MKDKWLSFLMSMIKVPLKFYIKSILQKIEDHNSRQVYENTLKSLNANFNLLNEVAKKTETKVDDDAIEGLLEAVQESAREDGVTL